MNILLGFMLIISCTFGLGIYLTNSSKKSLKNTKSILDLIKHIKRKIDFFNSPLDEIYESYKADDKDFDEFIKTIRHAGWSETFTNGNRFQLTAEVQQTLLEFGVELGKTNRNEQIILCNYCIEKLEKEYNEMQKNIPEKNKTTMALCLYGGVMIIILFI